jgi:hypothetical protein
LPVHSTTICFGSLWPLLHCPFDACQVSFITDDDENNRDEDIEDEFKLRQSRLTKLSVDGDTSKSALGPQDLLSEGLSRQLSLSTEDDDDDDESNSGDAKETVYYMPCANLDADTNFDR